MAGSSSALMARAWAAAARGAGMRYVVFTTKHHDGFCMFDTKQTDYRVTDPGCAFHADPRANITRQVFLRTQSELVNKVDAA